MRPALPADEVPHNQLNLRSHGRKPRSLRLVLDDVVSPFLFVFSIILIISIYLFVN